VDRPIVHALRGAAYEAYSPKYLEGVFSEVRGGRNLLVSCSEAIRRGASMRIKYFVRVRHLTVGEVGGK
jgi:hypothetical protein